MVSEPPRPSVVMSLVVETPWKPGDDRDLALAHRGADAIAPDLDDLGLAVVGVGDDPGLAPGEAHRRLTEVLDRHREEGHRDAFAGGEEHVHLPPTRMAGDVTGEAHEVVGGLAHRRDDHDDVAALPARPDDVVGDGPDAIRVRDRASAELLHQ